MTNYIKDQITLHPSITPSDVVKMCFQAAYGAEHLLSDIGKVCGYFVYEYENCQPNTSSLTEFIADEVCRVNLAAWKKHKLPWEWLFKLFVQSAAVSVKGGDVRFFEYIGAWSDFIKTLEGGGSGAAKDLLSKNVKLGFTLAEFQAYFQEYMDNCEGGKPQAVHHSPQYREAETPAYRVVSGAFIRLVPILQRLDGVRIIAIDGPSASGKSTLGAGLAAILGAQLIHMDDFFLPLDMRTPERLKEPGGNIHYERFAEEILPHIGVGKPFTYRVFDCETMTYARTRRVEAAPYIIVEGSYSHHPLFNDYMDLKVVSDVAQGEQLKRVLSRNGDEIADMFTTKWIPMEEEYFNAFGVKKNAHIVV